MNTNQVEQITDDEILTDDEICQKILNYRNIKNRIVILCEGTTKYLDKYSPSDIGKGEYYPDADFWTKTISVTWWRGKRPCFIPCGGRSNILNIKKRLVELHQEDPDNSYLSPDKLFALVDLDLEINNLSPVSTNYRTTEDVYHQTYQNPMIDPSAIQETKVIITGWRHKEAYFFEPDLENFFLEEKINLNYNDQHTSLEQIYQDMAQDISTDEEIRKQFNTVLARVQGFFNTPINDPQNLLDEWQKLWNNSSLTAAKKRDLIEVILKIVKSKDYWLKISFDEGQTRDDIMYSIARFYAQSCPDPHSPLSHFYHIPQWIRFLHQFH